MRTDINLAYGCAPIMGRYGKRESLYILESAFDLGIRHFDVARSYGYGEAEKLLGNFLNSRTDKVTVATKFGVLPSRKAKLFSFAKPFVRPFIKQKVPNSGDIVFNNQNIIDEHLLKKSIRQSLSALKMDKVDMLFIHEPNPNWLIPINLTEELNRLVDNEIISDWGISGYLSSIDKLLNNNPSFSNKIQTNSNVFNCEEVINIKNLYAVFSPFHRAYIINIINSMLLNEYYSSNLSKILQFEVNEKNASYLALFLMSPFTNENIILSTISPLRLSENTQAVLDAKKLSRDTAKIAIDLIREFKETSYA